MKRVRSYPFDRLPRVAPNQVEAGRVFRTHLPLQPGPSFAELERGLGGPVRFRLVECFVARARDLEALLAGVVVRLAAAGDRWALLVVDRALAVALAGAALGLDRTDGAELPAPRAPTLAEIGAIELIAQLLIDEQPAHVVGVVEGEDLLGLLGALPDEALVHVLEARVESAVGRGAARLIVPDALALAAPVQRGRAALLQRRARLDPVRASAVVELARVPIDGALLSALRKGDVLAFATSAPPRGGPLSVVLRIARGAFDARLDGDKLEITAPFRLYQGAQMPTDATSRASAEDGGADQLLRELPVEIVCELGRVTMSGRELIELEPGAVIPIARPLSGPVDLTVGGRLVARGELVDVEGDLGVRLTEVVE